MQGILDQTKRTTLAGISARMFRLSSCLLYSIVRYLPFAISIECLYTEMDIFHYSALKNSIT